MWKQIIRSKETLVFFFPDIGLIASYSNTVIAQLVSLLFCSLIDQDQLILLSINFSLSLLSLHLMALFIHIYYLWCQASHSFTASALANLCVSSGFFPVSTDIKCISFITKWIPLKWDLIIRKRQLPPCT